MGFEKNIVRTITLLAGIVVGVVVIVIPIGYFFLSHQYVVGSLEAEAEINARIITRIISADPDMWKFEQVRLKEYLSHRPKKDRGETRRILDMNGALIAESASELPRPVIKRSVELFDAGQVVGRLEIVRSLRPLLMRAGLLMLLMVPLGAVVFRVLRVLPIRAILRSESALRKERDTAHTYLEVVQVMLVALDAGQRVTLINRKGCEILGAAEQDILSKNWFDHFVPAGVRAATKAEFSRLMEGDGVPIGYFENPVLTGTGGVRTIAWRNIVLFDESGKAVGTLSSGEDITDRKRLEGQLRQAQKMEAIGLLAGGIAHDFNNILAAIIGYASLIKLRVNDDPEVQHEVEQILVSSDRAANLVKRLLAFSRKQIIAPRPVPVNDIVAGIQKLLLRLLRADIEMKVVLSDEVMTVRADAGQIEQILMNLATNARDAMPEGGQFFIKTSMEMLDHAYVTGHGYGTAGAFACISVSDTGFGMTETIKEKIFDPFFTTKEVGKGTGLGLSMSYGIVKQHDGYINVYSEPGKGTTFKIYLPLITSEIQETKREVQLPSSSVGGSETILIAEDDAVVRAMMKAVLQYSGYNVIEAADGEEALTVFAKQATTIHLVILDVIMPKKNGKVVFEEIKKMRPDIKILFTSGYTADVLDGQMDLLGSGFHFLSKPAASRDLLMKVRELLDEHSDKTASS